MSKNLFKFGKIVTTCGIDEAFEYPQFFPLLIRHASGDWGDVCAEDAQMNEQGVIHNDRIMSVYTLQERKVWIITEWDRSVTTILFPEEY